MGEGLERKRQERERQLANLAFERASAPSLQRPVAEVKRRVSAVCSAHVKLEDTLTACLQGSLVGFFHGKTQVASLDADLVLSVCNSPESAVFKVVSIQDGMIDLEPRIEDIRQVRPKIEEGND